MSRNERTIAALLLAVAVVGVALIPRLLSAPVTSLGVAIGPGPGRSIVVAPAIPRTPRRATPRRVTRPAEASAAAIAPTVKPISLRPPTKPREVPTKKVSPPPPTTTTPSTPTPVAPPPPSFRPPPVPPSPTAATSTRPGNGYGDKNHLHTGPPGHDPPAEQRPPAAPPVKPGPRNQGRDVPGSTDGRPLPQVSPHTVGARHRNVGCMAKAPARPAPPAPQARPKAWPEAGSPGGQGSQPAPPLAHGPKSKHS
jgi:hypothetical protein